MRVAPKYLVLAALAVAGCGSGTSYDPQTSPSDRLGVWTPDPSATLLHTVFSKLDAPTLAFVESPAPWLSLWNQAWG